MKSDLKCSHECKIEGRQSIHARKMSKTSPTRNGAVGTNVHIAADSGLPLTLSTVGDGVKYAKSQDCKRKMDNNDGKTGIATAVDGRLCMNEVMKAIDETPETKHLKDLLLLHLDWSQQQQELILAKDRQLRDLRSERDAVSYNYKILILTFGKLSRAFCNLGPGKRALLWSATWEVLVENSIWLTKYLILSGVSFL